MLNNEIALHAETSILGAQTMSINWRWKIDDIVIKANTIGIKMEILIIDKKKDLKKIICKKLEDQIKGCHVVTRDGASEGLLEFKKGFYDTVILSDRLPKADLFDILFDIRDKKGYEFPVVVITDNKNNQSNENDSFPEGCTYISQNCNFSEILAKIVDGAVRMYKLLQEKQSLQRKLVNAEMNQKAAEFALKCNHNINNPLTTILGNTQLLLKHYQNGDDQLMERLEKIEEAAHQIQKITLNLANSISINVG
ncbi:MAG: hypothetical protein B6D58_05610 [candidate division Zixibacteria bacterium 4484_95]|nr:MAG: hypothetical protein B6D58_05610 [candidate division Zixibacteria bacterium 4484_95]